MTRVQTAVQKASGQRLLADMRAAARLVQSLAIPASPQHGLAGHHAWTRGYALGACEYASATRRACLLTAFGA